MSGNHIVANLSVDIPVFLGCSGWCPVIIPRWLPILLLKFVPSSLFHFGQSSLLMASMPVVSQAYGMPRCQGNCIRTA